MDCNNNRKINNYHGQNSFSQWEIIYCQLKQVWIMRNKEKLNHHLLLTSAFFPGSPYPFILLQLSFSVSGKGQGMVHLYSFLLLTLLPCSSMRPFHRLQSFRRNWVELMIPQAAVCISTTPWTAEESLLHHPEHFLLFFLL